MNSVTKTRQGRQTVGIWTTGLDTKEIQAPALYTWRIIEQFLDSEVSDLDVVALHYRQWQHPVYEQMHDIVVPRIPLLGNNILRKAGIDLIHLNGLPGQPGSALFHALPPRTKRIATVHGNLHFFPDIPQHGSRWRHSFSRIVQRQSAKGFDHLIAVSGWLKDTLVEELGISSQKITRIYYGLSPIFRQLPERKVSAVLSEYEVEKNYILHVSNYMHKKNPHVLLDAFGVIHHREPDIRFVVVGGRWQRRDVLDHLERLELQGVVDFLGYLSQNKIAALYNGAKLCVYPSLHETFGMPIIEAMACGCPLVTTRTTAIPEIAGGAAVLADDPYDAEELAEKMLSVLSDSNLRSEMIERGLSRAKEFTWEKCAHETMGVYRRVLEL